MRFFLWLLLLAANVYAAPVTMDIPSIHLADALRLLAGYAHMNVVVSPEVSGTTSLHVVHQEPLHILNLLLKTHDLAKTQQGEIVYIAPRAVMIKSSQQEAEWQQIMENSAPLVSQVFNIRYARAAEIAAVMQGESSGLLSDRGYLSVDDRTNQLVVRDVDERLQIVSRLIKRLDVPVRQVLVEARLVSIDQDAERLLGIDFSVRQNETNQSQQMTHAEQQGKYSIAVAHLPDGSMLDVKLAALQREGRADLISSPSLFTGSQQEASIEAGEEVPYQEVSESGGTAVAFKKAVLGLKVTPQILPDNRVLMSLKINQDRPAVRMVQGVPVISTRQIMTNVQVKSGQTLVLGGIYEMSQSDGRHGLPFLGNIPVIGLLFTQQEKREQKRELLIFVTPKIMPQAI